LTEKDRRDDGPAIATSKARGLDACLRHLNPFPAALRVGQIATRATDAKASASTVQPQLSIEERSALEEPETPSTPPRTVPIERQSTSA
jgi:hypothetical protein